MGSALYVIDCPNCKKENIATLHDEYKDGYMKIDCDDCNYSEEFNYDINKTTAFEVLKELIRDNYEKGI